jgi:hypothetical protein
VSNELYARPRRVEHIEDCGFYHQMEIPGHGVVAVEHGWDLRGREPAYLGGVEFAGRRVLEIGPASGHLTFWMEAQGADVVAVELAPTTEWDVVPHAGLEMDRIRADRRPVMDRMRNSFWFAHERLGSSARVHYGSVYELPDLGPFDVAVLGSVLLHLRDPLRALKQITTPTIVICDRYAEELTGPVARFEPRRDSENWETWWRLTPGLVTEYLGVRGYSTATTLHEQIHVVGEGRYPVPMFTVVAQHS